MLGWEQPQVGLAVQQPDEIDRFGFVPGAQLAFELQQTQIRRLFDQMQHGHAFQLLAQFRDLYGFASTQSGLQRPERLGKIGRQPFHLSIDIRHQPGRQHRETSAAQGTGIVFRHELRQLQQPRPQHRFVVQNLQHRLVAYPVRRLFLHPVTTDADHVLAVETHQDPGSGSDLHFGAVMKFPGEGQGQMHSVVIHSQRLRAGAFVSMEICQRGFCSRQLRPLPQLTCLLFASR
ncbi:MAG: hypothetical protein BWX83_00284 [Candidatus Cloacimonetes bacterium ADurb.Bin117]|nr:MAG: hypothetical protein BWX83_00284 [Candidatus Cloacimonetes bacterium ADurb.Bin117]